nr:hypothetical protein [Tanacetum cinerariifolium]
MVYLWISLFLTLKKSLRKEDPQEEHGEEFKEDPTEELVVDVEEDAPPAATPSVRSPITLPPLSESSSDTKAVVPVVASGTLEMPPPGSTFEVGGPSSISAFPPFYLHGQRRIQQCDIFSSGKALNECDIFGALNDNAEMLFSSGRVTWLENSDQEKKDKMEKIKKRLEMLEANYALVLSVQDRWERAFYNVGFNTWIFLVKDIITSDKSKMIR